MDGEFAVRLCLDVLTQGGRHIKIVANKELIKYKCLENCQIRSARSVVVCGPWREGGSRKWSEVGPHPLALAAGTEGCEVAEVVSFGDGALSSLIPANPLRRLCISPYLGRLRIKDTPAITYRYALFTKTLFFLAQT